MVHVQPPAGSRLASGPPAEIAARQVGAPSHTSGPEGLLLEVQSALGSPSGQRLSTSISLARMFAFAVSNLPCAAVTLALGVFLPRHYAQHIGLGLGMVGGAFFAVRMIDIPIDVILGLAMDRTRTPIGRYRPWAIGAAAVMAFSVYFLFNPPVGAGRLYLIIWLLFSYLGLSTFMLANMAWASRLAPHYHDRSRIFGVIMALGVFGAASIMAVPLINEHLHLSDALNVPTMGRLIAIMTPITLLISIIFTPEPIAPPRRAHKAMRFHDAVRLLMRPALRRILGAELCFALGPGWMSASYLFFFTDVLHFTVGKASVLLGAYLLAGILGAPLAAALAKRFSKHRALIGVAVFYVLTIISLSAIPPGNLPVAAICLFGSGAMAYGFTTLTRAMMADVADEVRLEEGRERPGLLYGLTVLAGKLGSAFSVGLTFFMISLVGFKPALGFANSHQAVLGFQFVFLGGPIVFVLLGAACMLGYALTPDRHADIRRQLSALDALELAQAPGLGGLGAPIPRERTQA